MENPVTIINIFFLKSSAGLKGKKRKRRRSCNFHQGSQDKDIQKVTREIQQHYMIKFVKYLRQSDLHVWFPEKKQEKATLVFEHFSQQPRKKNKQLKFTDQSNNNRTE